MIARAIHPPKCRRSCCRRRPASDSASRQRDAPGGFRRPHRGTPAGSAGDRFRSFRPRRWHPEYPRDGPREFTRQIGPANSIRKGLAMGSFCNSASPGEALITVQALAPSSRTKRPPQTRISRSTAQESLTSESTEFRRSRNENRESIQRVGPTRRQREQPARGPSGALSYALQLNHRGLCLEQSLD